MLVAAVIGLAAARVVPRGSTKIAFGAWLSLIVGLGLGSMYAFRIDRDPFVVVLAVICLMGAARSFEMRRLHLRIQELESRKLS